MSLRHYIRSEQGAKRIRQSMRIILQGWGLRHDSLRSRGEQSPRFVLTTNVFRVFEAMSMIWTIIDLRWTCFWYVSDIRKIYKNIRKIYILFTYNHFHIFHMLGSAGVAEPCKFWQLFVFLLLGGLWGYGSMVPRWGHRLPCMRCGESGILSWIAMLKGCASAATEASLQ